MNQLVSYKQVFLARDTYPSVMNALLGYFVPQVFKGLFPWAAGRIDEGHHIGDKL